MPYIFYAELESLIKKNRYIFNIKNRKSLTSKIGENIPLRHSMSTIWAFDNIENKHTLYRGDNLHDLHNDLPFLCERIIIEKVKNLVANLHDKTEYVICIRDLKQSLNHGLVLKIYI